MSDILEWSNLLRFPLSNAFDSKFQSSIEIDKSFNFHSCENPSFLSKIMKNLKIPEAKRIQIVAFVEKGVAMKDSGYCVRAIHRILLQWFYFKTFKRSFSQQQTLTQLWVHFISFKTELLVCLMIFLKMKLGTSSLKKILFLKFMSEKIVWVSFSPVSNENSTFINLTNFILFTNSFCPRSR